MLKKYFTSSISQIHISHIFLFIEIIFGYVNICFEVKKAKSIEAFF